MNRWLSGGRKCRTLDEESFVGFERSELYQRVLRPLGYDRTLMATVYGPTRPAGVLMIHRPKKTPGFSIPNKRHVTELTDYIACGLYNHDQRAAATAPSGEIGLCIFSQPDRLQYVCPTARQLLFYAAYPPVGKVTPSYAANPIVLPEVRQLCRELIASARGHAGAPPLWRVQNAWGVFVFRARWLEPTADGSNLIAVSVVYEEPLQMKVMRRCAEYRLPPKQSEICALLCMGYTYQGIGRRLGISVHTVIDHVRKIYDALGVGNRSELVATLTGGERPF